MNVPRFLLLLLWLSEMILGDKFLSFTTFPLSLLEDAKFCSGSMKLESILIAKNIGGSKSVSSADLSSNEGTCVTFTLYILSCSSLT